MTREEQILNKAIDYSEIEENFLEYDDCGDVCDDKDFVEKAFIEGAKWSDEHPNLYNDEKYHTVKVSCLDELYRKSGLYDAFVEKACEWLEEKLLCAEDYYPTLEFLSIIEYNSLKELINDFRKSMDD